jgi:hypothetical protein
MSFQIDGREWDYPCQIDRIVELTDSDVSGLMMDKREHHDVIGAYLRFEVTVAFPILRNRNRPEKAAYYGIHNELTDPVDAHEFVMPYNDGFVTVTAHVDSVRDTYVRLPHDVDYWQGISFTCTSIAPMKTYTLDELIARGFAPLPDEGGAQIGELYEYTADGWVLVEFADADYISY